MAAVCRGTKNESKKKRKTKVNADLAFFGRPFSPQMRTTVLVYTGPGAGARSALSAAAALEASLPRAHVTTQAHAAALASTEWHASTAAIVLPGGADSPYARDLAGAPNASIRSFVEGGGTYIGLCAGAYYGCAAIDFEPTDPALAVAGPRELAFFKGRALGAAVPGFEYETERGSAAVELAWRRAAPNAPWRRARDYCNGGPVFVAADGASPLPDDDEDAGVRVVARYVGGVPPGPSPAVAAARANGAAAVRCAVGAGVAVLCGTHPELSPAARWLDPSSDVARALDACDGRPAFWDALCEAAGLSGLK